MTHVLVVDDAPDNRLILESMLSQSYQVSSVESGEACLEFCQQDVPDVIVLDVEMPGLDGYDTCKALRNLSDTATVPVIFATGKDTQEERLTGFEVGGNAYLTKPINNDALIEQIERSQLTRRAAIQAQNDANNAMNVAMEAMTSSSELGQIIEFVKQVQETERRINVAQLLVSAMADFGLNIAVYIPDAKDPFCNCMEGSLEAKLMQKAYPQPGRILSFGIRTIVKSDVLVMLVKNMPIHDEAKYGRFKDHLAVMLTIAEGRILAIRSQLESHSEQVALLEHVINTTKGSVQSVNQAFDKHDNTVKSVMLDMITELESLLFGLGLDEDQEETLMRLVYNSSEKLSATEKSKQQLTVVTQSIIDGLLTIRQKL